MHATSTAPGAAAPSGPDAGMRREWLAPFRLDARLILSVHRRGRRDPAFSVEDSGAVWRTSLTPDGPGTAARHRPRRGRRHPGHRPGVGPGRRVAAGHPARSARRAGRPVRIHRPAPGRRRAGAPSPGAARGPDLAGLRGPRARGPGAEGGRPRSAPRLADPARPVRRARPGPAPAACGSARPRPPGRASRPGTGTGPESRASGPGPSSPRPAWRAGSSRPATLTPPKPNAGCARSPASAPGPAPRSGSGPPVTRTRSRWATTTCPTRSAGRWPAAGHRRRRHARAARPLRRAPLPGHPAHRARRRPAPAPRSPHARPRLPLLLAPSPAPAASPLLAFKVSGIGVPRRRKASRWVLVGSVSIGTVARAPANRTWLRVKVARCSSRPRKL